MSKWNFEQIQKSNYDKEFTIFQKGLENTLEK